MKAKSFKTRSDQSTAVAWCVECSWDTDRHGGKTAIVCKLAKKHTEQTGHKTLIDITKQRGYQVIESISPIQSDEGADC